MTAHAAAAATKIGGNALSEKSALVRPQLKFAGLQL